MEDGDDRKKKMESIKKNISIIFFIFFIMIVSTAVGLDSDDIDEICNENENILYRYNGTWGCGNMSDTMVSYYYNNITNIINNYTLFSNQTNYWDGYDDITSYINGTNIWLNSLGIGIQNPTVPLDVFGDIKNTEDFYLGDSLKHTEDTDTLMDFANNLIQFYAGGIRFLIIQKTEENIINFNTDNENIDFKINSLIGQAFHVDGETGDVNVSQTLNVNGTRVNDFLYNLSRDTNTSLWENWLTDAITIINKEKNVYLFSNISFNNTGGGGILTWNLTYLDINFTFNSTTDTTLGDFSNGTNNYANLSYQSGNVTLNFNSNNLKDTLLLMHFDENYTLNTNLTDDVSIYNNNGVCINMTVCPTFNSSGYIGGAFEFDGGDDYINIATPLKLDSGTASAWIKINSSAEGMIISGIWTNLNLGIEIISGKIASAITGNAGDKYQSTNTYNDGNWHYIVLVKTGMPSYPDAFKLYTDGVQVAFENTSTASRTSTRFALGMRESTGWSLPFNGTIDEVRIYNRSLTQDEITRNYQAGLKKLSPSLNNYQFNATFTSQIFDLGLNPNMSKISWGHSTPHSSYYYQNNLIFGWDGSSLYNYVNTSMVGTAGGGLLVGNNYSIFPDNNGTYFNGTTYLDTGSNNLGFISTDDLTFSVWFKTINDYSSVLGDILSNYNSATPTGWHIYMDTTNKIKVTNFRTSGGNQRYILSGSILNDGNWHHAVGIILGDGSDVDLYIDGVSQGESTLQGTVSELNMGSGTVKIGVQSNPYNTRFFNGTIDEVHIWKRALSSSEISAMYNISKVKYPIVMQTRMGNNATDTTNWGNWVNGSGGSGYYINSTGEQINYTYNGSARYIQYRALFETLDTNSTPILNYVNFSYISNSTTIIPSQPQWGNTTNLTTIYAREGELYIKSEIDDSRICTEDNDYCYSMGDIITQNLNLGGNEITDVSYLRTYGHLGEEGYLSYIASLGGAEALIFYSSNLATTGVTLTLYGTQGLQYDSYGASLPFFPEDDAYNDIGTKTKRWRDGFFSGNITANNLNIGNITSVNLPQEPSTATSMYVCWDTDGHMFLNETGCR